MAKRRQKKITNSETDKEIGPDQAGNGLADGRSGKIKKPGVKTGRSRSERIKNFSKAEVEAIESINQPAATDKTGQADEPAERKKRLITHAGIGCIMAALFIVWLFNLKHEFKAGGRENPNQNFNWDQARTELNKTLEQIKMGLAEIKRLKNSSADGLSVKRPELTPEQLDLLKGKLLEETASTTSGTIKK